MNRREYTIGSESYIPVNGPGSSYYTSICDMCAKKTSALFEYSNRHKLLLCKDCFAELSQVRTYVSPEPLPRWTPMDIAVTAAFIVTTISLFFLAVALVWIRVSG